MELKYIVYITINLCNGKFYIGVHKTNPEVFDNYIGLGVYRQSNATGNYPLHKAVRKYGYKNFRRTTIKIFDDSEEGRKAAFDLERVLVNETLIKSKNCYNIALGGFGSVKEDSLKTVYMFDLKGNYLRSFKSAREAALHVDPENQDNARSAIKNNCLGATNSSYGFFWSYKKEFKYSSEKKVKVAQYTLSGKFLRYFDSIAEAESELKLNSIEQAITKGYQCGGYQWKYFNGDFSDIGKLLNTFTKLQVLPIIMYDKKGNKVEEFSSVKDCVAKYPELQTSQISRVLKGVIKSHKGYVFKYKNEDIV